MPSPVRTEQSCIDMPNLNQLRSIIENNLTHDWILRVEHTSEVMPNSNSWQQWGEASFAIREATPVMKNITACRDRYPMHNIRLHAEKLNPRTRMLFCVYRKPESVPLTLVPQETATKTPGVPLQSAVTNGIGMIRSNLWRIAAVGGMLLASLLLLEEAMI